jgi:hypothetical protein
MTRQSRLPRQHPDRPCMPRACHERSWPGAANLPAREFERKAVAGAPTNSNAATVTTAPFAGLDLFLAAASNAPIPTENSIGRS